MLTILSVPSGADELVIIQSVSGSRKTFVITKGKLDGIYEGQESIFSNNDASIKAKVIESSRHFSLWKTSGNKTKVPFAKKDYVNYSPNVEQIWTDISRISHNIDKERAKFALLGTRYPSFWLIRANLSNSISEAVSGTNPAQPSSRSGIQFELLYSSHLATRFEWSAGIRYDNETISINTPSLTIPTIRYFGVLEILYHFPHLTIFKQKTYVGLGMALGRSSTQSSGQSSSGSAFAVPFRFGAILPIFAGYSLTLEAVVESVYVKEAFDNGTQQSTNLINGKLALGLKF